VLRTADVVVDAAELKRCRRLGIRIEPDSSFECDHRLDSSRFRETTGYAPPSWQAMVEELARDTTPYDWRKNLWISMANTSS
jgi:hypothetical protein